MARTTTSFSRAGDKLSHRLSTLHHYYRNEAHIWDVGCDHGLLGLSFIDTETVKSINFVDPSHPVIEVLKKKIKDSYISTPDLNIHPIEGQRIEPEQSSNLIFIAGMGGKEIGEIIQSILPKLDQTSRIVISPHRKIIELRSLLNSLPLSLLSEKVIEEDQQFYQILELTPSPIGMKTPLYGDSIWSGETGEKYLSHQIKHYESHKDLASQKYLGYLKSLKPLKTTPKENL